MPLAPVPTTISFVGASLSTMSSRYWMMRSPSICVPGRLRARAPVAMMKLASVTPVSYTHLDVYKRQALIKASTTSSM